MSDLTKSIQALYQDRISQETAEIAAGNLVEFFRVLQGVDERLQRKVNITQNVNNEVMESYENNRSSNRTNKTK